MELRVPSDTQFPTQVPTEQNSRSLHLGNNYGPIRKAVFTVSQRTRSYESAYHGYPTMPSEEQFMTAASVMSADS